MSDSVTLRDLAKHLGLGKSTVQRALSGHPSIKPVTRQKVIAAATKMGYRPDPFFSIVGSQKRKSRSNGLPVAYLCRKGPWKGPSVGRDLFA